MTRPTPPRLAVWLLERVLAPEDREFILGDLHDAYIARLAAGGDSKTENRRCWRELWTALGPSIRRRRELARRYRGPRHTRRGSSMDSWLRDLRHAGRLMGKNPGFTAIAVVTLALGIGANTAIFTVVRATLLEPLPYRDPEALAVLTVGWTEGGSGRGRSVGHGLSQPELIEFREGVESFTQIGAYWFSPANVTGEGEPERIQAGVATPEVFQILGTPPLHGRWFTEDEGRPGGESVALLSHGFWTRRHAADPSVLGHEIQIDGQPYTVVGIMPPGLALPHAYGGAARTQLWVPMQLDPANLQGRGSHYLFAVARLREGRTLEQARAELVAVGRSLTEAGHYRAESEFGGGAMPVEELVLGAIRPVLLVLLAAVGFVLLIACANVANLLLARAEGRRRELALRSALGASRGALVRQLLTEGVALGLLGGIAGVALAYVGVRLLVAMQPTALPRVGEIAVDPTILGYALAISLGTGLLFGSAPAFLALRGRLHASLKEGGRAGQSRSRHVFQRSLVAVQMAFAVLLVIGAGLTVKSFTNLLAIDPGFRPQRVLSAQLALPDAAYSTPESIIAFYSDLVRAAEDLPAVERAAAVRVLPLADRIGDWSISIEGRERRPGEDFDGDWQIVTPGYFETLGIPLLQGRTLEHHDDADSMPSMVVNETMAKRYWPGESALGKRVQLGTAGNRPWITVVGVVGDVRHNGISSVVTPKWYLPHAQFAAAGGGAMPAMTVVLRTSGEPTAVLGHLRRLVRSRDPQLPIAEVRTMDDVLAASVGRERFTMSLLSTFGLVALGLAAIGVYGVLSFLVSQRTHEIGVRMALGATRGRVLKLIVGQGLTVAAVGVGMGVAAAAWLTKPLGSMLYEVGARDVPTFVVVPLTLAAVAAVAALVPARRAVATDPVQALRDE